MTEALITVVLFVVGMALLPFAVRWLQRRQQPANLVGASPRLVSALAVGPNQRVVTVEVGPDGQRTWLVLGVTAQSVNCLHTLPAVVPAASFVQSLASQQAPKPGGES